MCDSYVRGYERVCGTCQRVIPLSRANGLILEQLGPSIGLRILVVVLQDEIK